MKSDTDPVIQWIQNKSQSVKGISRVYLFGSRARKDAHSRSDYDFAFETLDLPHSEWASFALDLKENVPTLCGIDVVCLDEKTSDELRNKIFSEGVLIYEQKQ